MRTIVRDLDGTLLTRGGHGYADATVPPTGSLEFLKGRGLARDWSPSMPRAPGLNGGGAPPPASTKSGLSIALREDAPSQEEVAAPGGTLDQVSVAFNNARWAAGTTGDKWAVYQGPDGYIRLMAWSEGRPWEEVYVSADRGLVVSDLNQALDPLPTARPALAVISGAAAGGRTAVILAWFRPDLDVAVVELTRTWSAFFGRYLLHEPVEYRISNSAGTFDEQEQPNLSLVACQTGEVYLAWARGSGLEWIRSSSAGDWESATVQTVPESRECRFPTLACSGVFTDGGPVVLLAWKATAGTLDNIACIAGWVGVKGRDDLEGAGTPTEVTAYGRGDGVSGRDPCAWASPSGTFFIGFNWVGDVAGVLTNDIWVASASAAQVTTGTFGAPELVSSYHRSGRTEDGDIVAANFVSGSATDTFSVVTWEEGPLKENGGATAPFCREIYLATARVSEPNVWTQWGEETNATAAFIPTDELDPATQQGQYPCVVLSDTAIRDGEPMAALSLFWILGQDAEPASIRLLQGDVDDA